MLTLFDIIKGLVEELELNVTWSTCDEYVEPDSRITKKDIIATIRTKKGNHFQTRIGIFVEPEKFGIYGDHNIAMSWNPADPKALDEFQHYLTTKYFDQSHIKTDDTPKYKYYPY